MNLIFTSFHYNPVANKSHSVKLETYLHNIFTSLASAKINNPDDVVALITTEETSALLPSTFKKLLSKYKIECLIYPFEFFLGNESQIWSFSFYRLSIMYSLSRKNIYDNICSIDSDIFVVENFDDVWEDCKNFILLYDLNHDHKVIQSKDTYNDYYAYKGDRIFFSNYGGEFIAGSSILLNHFLQHCLCVFNSLMSNNILFSHGDETVLSFSAYENKTTRIKNASPYVYRFWTSHHFKMVSTVYKYNCVHAYHVPDEKIYGLESLYRYFIRHSRFPKKTSIPKILGISCHQNFRPIVLFRRFINKINPKK